MLCCVPYRQAGRWLQRDNNFGVSGQIDPLEGWIADPSSMRTRATEAIRPGTVSDPTEV